MGLLQRRLSPLGRNILLINLIALMVPVSGILYLADYQDELIRVETRNVREKSRIFADSLAEGAIDHLSDGSGFFNLGKALEIVHRHTETTRSRVVLFLNDGTPLIDSRQMNRRVIVRRFSDDDANPFSPKVVLGMIGDTLLSLLDFEPERLPFREPAIMNIQAFPSAIAALQNTGQSNIYAKGNDTLVITTASPVRVLHRIFAVLVLVHETRDIQATTNALRRNILIAFLIALLFVVTTSLLIGRRIAEPLAQLARAAARFSRPEESLNKLRIPSMPDRNDEISTLAQALSAMTENLKSRITSIERFSADVAHELRNPISGITSALETYRLVKSPDKKNQLLDMAQKDLARLDILIDDILECSQLDAALMGEGRETIELAACLEKIIAHHQHLFPDRRIALDLPEAPLPIAIKTSRLEQVFHNLLGNALEFQQSAQPIEVSLEASADRQQAIIRVADRGPGIPESARQKIFDRFYTDRPDQSRSSHSGLGLAIVHQIVTSAGGRIEAGNRPEGGAEFVLTFPLSRG